jgi:hypothetical protein
MASTFKKAKPKIIEFLASLNSYWFLMAVPTSD